MIDLEARAHTLNQEAVTPRLAVDVVLERARRIRKRRRLGVVAFCCSLIVGGAVAVALRSSRASNPAVVVSPSTASRRVTKPTVPAPALVTAPDRAIVHELGGSARPGRVEVVDTTTGRTLRVLGADYDPYLQNGFAIARSSGLALWTRLNQPAQTLELVEVPIAGGAEHVLGSTNPLGSGPVSPGPLLTAVSPDGKQLWMNGDKIVDLATGHQVNVPQPPFVVGARWGGATWLPDGHHLFVIELQALSNCDRSSPLGRVPSACETTTTAGTRGSHGWTYDLNDPTAGWHGAASPPRTEGWSDLQILGPGRLPSTVVAVATGSSSKNAGEPRMTIMTVDVNSGLIADEVTTSGDSVLAVDASGTNILFAESGHLERLSLADRRPVIVRQGVAEAAW